MVDIDSIPDGLYLEFANLATNDEIASFLEKTGPLGFETFQLCWETGVWIPEEADPELEKAELANRIAKFFKENRKSDKVSVFNPQFWLDLLRGMELAERDRNEFWHEENPDNVRRHADAMRQVITCHHQLSSYKQFHDAKLFVKEILKPAIVNEAALSKIDEVGWHELAEFLVGSLEEYVDRTFKLVLQAVTVTVKNGFLDYASSCLIAGLWFQLVQDLLIDKKFPRLCNHCGRTFTSARPWGKYCDICGDAARKRDYRKRKVAREDGRELYSGPGRPPKNGVTKKVTRL
jgi:hypothetical protein